MVVYPSCPKCTNTVLSIVDAEIDGMKLKCVQCNNCHEILWLFQDKSNEIKELNDKIEDIESSITDIEDAINTNR